ncbi:hypothetical protein DdX_14257 [Ditylenchus destructor]|uniref:DUF7808 domain-containing protein n=1 Tax=Ditylenchus destructor TaxID=166010 RepID=A0AAD4MUV4_9BILA|nr:hypothetical protein DdX_14257 [Ditylenchus destructor]
MARTQDDFSVLLLLLILSHASFVLSLSLAKDESKEASESNYASRQYTCIVHEELEPADCRLSFRTDDDEPATLTDSGCFIEKEPVSQQLRNYCPLQCAGASFAYISSHRPNKTGTDTPPLNCLPSMSFDVSRRPKDWFLWRSGDCLSTEAQFDINCEYNSTSNGTTAMPRETNGVGGQQNTRPNGKRGFENGFERGFESATSRHIYQARQRQRELESQELLPLRPTTIRSQSRTTPHSKRPTWSTTTAARQTTTPSPQTVVLGDVVDAMYRIKAAHITVVSAIIIAEASVIN